MRDAPPWRRKGGGMLIRPRSRISSAAAFAERARSRKLALLTRAGSTAAAQILPQSVDALRSPQNGAQQIHQEIREREAQIGEEGHERHAQYAVGDLVRH